MRWEIKGTVGQGQRNDRRDVRIVQKLLNRSSGGQGEILVEDGIWGPRTMSRLMEFQRNAVHLRSVDSIVNTQGPTIRKLNDIHSNSGHKSSHHSALPANHVILVPEEHLNLLVMKEAKKPPANHKVAWFNRALPAAINVKAHWGVPIAVTLAQGAVESDWGRHAPHNMFFGIKGRSPKGQTVQVTTHENYNGKNTTINAGFRAYAGLEEAAEDYGRFLSENKRYRAAFAFGNQPEQFIHVVAKAGYATNPGYEKIILSVIRSNGLSDYDTPGMTRYVRFTNPLHE